MEKSEQVQDARLVVHDTTIEKLKDRLPNWATAVIALLMGAIGWLAR